MKYTLGPFLLSEEQHSLFYDGRDIALPPKVFSILLLLVEFEGRTVSQELLRERVWPDSYVEDAAVSKNISVLRAALRPCVGDIEVIRTLPKRGYQLLLPVERVEEQEPIAAGTEAVRAAVRETMAGAPEPVPQPDESTVPLQADSEAAVPFFPPILSAPSASSPSASVPSARKRSETVRSARVRLVWFSLWAAALASLVLLAVFGYHRHERQRSIQAEQRELAVIDFRDLSGNPADNWIGVALQETLLHALSRDGGIITVTGDQAALAEEDLGLNHAPAFDAAELAQLSNRLGAEYLITGTYMLLGEQIRVDLVLHQGARVLRDFSETVARSDLQASLEQISAQMRASLGLPRAQTGGDLQFFGKEQLAAHFYAEGLGLSRTGDTPRLARESFSRAVEADPQFAEAHEALATAWEKVGHSADSRKEAQLALATCGSLSETRRLLVQGAAYREVGDYPRSLEALARLRQMHPGDPAYKLAMARTLFSMDRYADAIVLLREIEADKTRPPNLPALELLATILAQQGDKSAKFMYADRIMKLARAQGSTSAEARAHLYAGMGWMGARDGAKAVAEFEEGEKLSAGIGDKVGEIAALTDETAALMEFHLPGAMAVGQRAIDMATEIGEDGSVSNECINLGSIAMNDSQLRSAASYFKRALEISAETQDNQTRLAALHGLASTYLLAEDLPGAEKAAALEWQDVHEIDNEQDVALTLQQQAQIDAYLGRWAQAAAKFQQVAVNFQHVGNPPAMNDVLVEYAWMLLQQGAPAHAADILHTVDPRVLDDSRSLADYAEGRLRNAAGNATQAENLVSKALARDRVPYSTANGLAVLMEIAVQRKDATGAHEVAERFAALSRSIPQDGEVRRGAVRAAAQAELMAGNRGGEAVRMLPQLLQEASRLGHAVEVAQLQRVLADSRR
jgi:DNA-binding winged helix-turn-helix (wHTH) protein/Tfp pilus assembly protein PilF/TolB-like protein